MALLLDDTQSATLDSEEDLLEDPLTPMQHQVIALLAQGQSITAAAAACNLHRTTVHHWKREIPDFADALCDAQSDAADHWRAVAVQHAATAFNTIQHLMNDPKTPASVRLKAALFILNQVAAAPKPLDTAQQQNRARRQYLKQRLQEIDAEHARLDAVGEQWLAEQRAEARLQYGDEAVDAAMAWGDQALAGNDDDELPPIPSLSYAAPPQQPYVRPTPKIGRNEPCPCGSTLKYKKCCLNKPA